VDPGRFLWEKALPDRRTPIRSRCWGSPTSNESTSLRSRTSYAGD